MRHEPAPQAAPTAGGRGRRRREVDYHRFVSHPGAAEALARAQQDAAEEAQALREEIRWLWSVIAYLVSRLGGRIAIR